MHTPSPLSFSTPKRMTNDMGLRINIDDSFMESHSFSCPSATTSFSSTPSVYDPFTPGSGRSTPQRRRSDYDSSFCSDDVPFAMTPPSSHGSAVDSYFPMEMRSSFSSDMMSDYQPATPTRMPSHMLPMSLPSQQQCMSQITPQHHMELYHLDDSLVSPPPLMFPTPHSHIQGPQMMDMSEMWVQGPIDSPVSFFESPSILRSNNRPSRVDEQAFNFNSKRSGMCFSDAQQKSDALHRITHLFPPLRSQGREQQQQQQRRAAAKLISVEKRGSFKCDVPGCKAKPYKRMEHLKRHKLSFHEKSSESYTCEFCGKTFKNRRDNYRSHLLLHTKKKSRNGRTDYYEAAEVRYAEEMQQTKQRGLNKRLRMDEVCC